MDELNNQDPVDEIIEEEELGLTDKIVGVLSEPSGLFSSLSKLPVKTMDWFFPVLLVIIVLILSFFVTMSNPEIKADAVEQQMEMIEKNFQEMVDKGQMTQEKADEQLDKIAERMEKGGGAQAIIRSVGIFIVSFIAFFIIAGVFYLLAKFALNGEGSYKEAMIAYGMPYYIIALQLIVATILAMLLGRLFTDTSVGSFLQIKPDTFTGMLLHKLDLFSIWFYAVVSIAFAKMFKSESVAPYFAGVFGLWIGFSILTFFAAKALPFLKWFGM